MSTLILSIIASILSFFLTNNYFYFFLVLIGIYYTIRNLKISNKNIKAETFASLNLILISAIALLGKFRPYSLEGLNFIIYGSFLSVIYDIFKKWYTIIPMFVLTGIGISLIAAVKLGKVGLFFGLILIPVVLREYSIQKSSK
ncbi:MAG: hypothetical protein ACK4MM_00800 [Fervidobacterium sp.]